MVSFEEFLCAFPKTSNDLIQQYDTNGDNHLSRKEVEKLAEAMYQVIPETAKAILTKTGEGIEKVQIYANCAMLINYL